jgi:hypothetical protein
MPLLTVRQQSTRGLASQFTSNRILCDQQRGSDPLDASLELELYTFGDLRPKAQADNSSSYHHTCELRHKPVVEAWRSSSRGPFGQRSNGNRYWKEGIYIRTRAMDG